MKYLIPGWVHNPGVHCASTAISDAMTFHGHGLSEAMCFGLGCGLGFSYFGGEFMSPSRMTQVRSRVLEQRFFENLARPFKWITDPDPDRCLAAAKEHLNANLPLLIKADILHLPHYNTKTRFPGHVILLWGYDDGEAVALIADTGWAGLLEVPYHDLNQARYSGVVYMKNSGDHYPVLPGEPIDDLRPAIKRALREQAEDLLGLSVNVPGVFGFDGMKKAQESLPGWAEAEDWKWSARWFYQVIEKRGTGGGAFRKLYSSFLSEAREIGPSSLEAAPAEEMKKIAEAWTDLAMLMKEISEGDEPREFDKAARLLSGIRETEESFFNNLLDVLGRD